MRFHADAVTGAVGEFRSITFLGDDPAGGVINFAGFDAGFDYLTSGFIGPPDDIIDTQYLLIGFAEEEAARDVRFVFIEGAANVHHDHVAGIDDALGERVMREGAIRSRTDDGEISALGAILLEEAGDQFSHFALGHARSQCLKTSQHGAIRQQC